MTRGADGKGFRGNLRPRLWKQLIHHLHRLLRCRWLAGESRSVAIVGRKAFTVYLTIERSIYKMERDVVGMLGTASQPQAATTEMEGLPS